MDIRLQPILRSETHTMRFVALGLARLLEDANALDDVFDSMEDRGVDMTEMVAGKTFAHWYGKSRGDVEREGVSDEQMEQVHAAHEKRGLPFVDEPTGEPDEPVPGHPDNAVAGETSKPQTVTTEAESTDEPVFGTDRIPLSHLRGKSDEELLAMKGIGRATIVHIREAESRANTT